MGGQALVLAILMGAFCYSGRKNTHKSGRGARALDISLDAFEIEKTHNYCNSQTVTAVCFGKRSTYSLK